MRNGLWKKRGVLQAQSQGFPMFINWNSLQW